MTRRVKQAALDAGFHLAAVTGAAPLDSDRQYLSDWLAAGHAATMDYMARTAAIRADPQALLEGARSLLCLATFYRQARTQPPPAGGGRVARYAFGRDYHRVLSRRLRVLGLQLEGLAGRPVRWRMGVDSKPLLERAIAARAGLGFAGKNTMLIRPGMGSYFFLAWLITDLDLVPDSPLGTDCGACDLCLRACPTGALVAPMSLDARRCISYLTIESKDQTPSHLAAAAGDWVFGCDVCQEVCPYNRGTLPAGDAQFDPEKGAGEWVPAEVFETMAPEAFVSRYAGTPLMRAGIAGMRRNTARIQSGVTARADVPGPSGECSPGPARSRNHPR